MIEEEEDLCLFGITYYLAFKNGLFKKLYLVKEKGILKSYIKKKNSTRTQKQCFMANQSFTHTHYFLDFHIYIYIYVYILVYIFLIQKKSTHYENEKEKIKK